MADAFILPCPHCNTPYEMTAEYLAQYGGQQITCTTCNNVLTLPTAQEMAGGPRVLAYEGPEFTNKRRSGRHWAEGNLLVMERGADLPPRCVKCDGDAPHPHIRCVVRWSEAAASSPTGGGMVLFSLIGSTGMYVKLGLCARHKRMRRIITWSWLVLFLASLATVIVLVGQAPLSAEMTYVAVTASIMLVLAPTGIVLSRRILTPKYMDHRIVKLAGASPLFLEKLPPPPHLTV